MPNLAKSAEGTRKKQMIIMIAAKKMIYNKCKYNNIIHLALLRFEAIISCANACLCWILE